MRKLPTGELCAGEPHAQFGGRGGRESFPTPIPERSQPRTQESASLAVWHVRVPAEGAATLSWRVEVRR